jgi:hypothetical protein
MKTLALLTLSLAMLASISASFAEPSYQGYGTYRGYRGKRIGDQKKCTSPYDYRCSTPNGA